MHLSSRGLATLLVAGLVGVGIQSAEWAKADSINVSTGLDSSNSLILSGGVSDAHWIVPPAAGGAAIAAQTVYPNNADWYGGWATDGPNSDWIARNASVTNNGAAPYTFTTTFDLTGYNLSTAALSGSWAIDDAGSLSLNGNSVASLGSGAWGSLTPFSVPTSSADFVAGVNTLSITITSDDQFLEAVRLEGTVTANRITSTPEPDSTALLIGLGTTAAGLVLRSRLRRKQSDTVQVQTI